MCNDLGEPTSNPLLSLLVDQISFGFHMQCLFVTYDNRFDSPSELYFWPWIVCPWSIHLKQKIKFNLQLSNFSSILLNAAICNKYVLIRNFDPDKNNIKYSPQEISRNDWETLRLQFLIRSDISLIRRKKY